MCVSEYSEGECVRFTTYLSYHITNVPNQPPTPPRTTNHHIIKKQYTKHAKAQS